jgi:threonine aldolase
MQQFASDNQAGICPEAFAAMAGANMGHEPSYGDDRWTDELRGRMRALFETDACETFLVFNGTSANALALTALCRPFEATICHALSHIETDEAAAPEFFTGGARLVPSASPGSRLDADVLAHAGLLRLDFGVFVLHAVQALAIHFRHVMVDLPGRVRIELHADAVGDFLDRRLVGAVPEQGNG